MEEELKALKDLIAEMAREYNIYIDSSSFYGDGADLTFQRKKDEGSGKFDYV